MIKSIDNKIRPNFKYSQPNFQGGVNIATNCVALCKTVVAGDGASAASEEFSRSTKFLNKFIKSQENLSTTRFLSV